MSNTTRSKYSKKLKKAKVNKDEPTDRDIKKNNKEAEKLNKRWEQDLAEIRQQLEDDELDTYNEY